MAVPMCVMRDASLIVHPIRLIPNRFQPSKMAEDPVLLEPGYMRHLPAQRIDYIKARAKHLLIVQISDQIKSSCAGLL